MKVSLETKSQHRVLTPGLCKGAVVNNGQCTVSENQSHQLQREGLDSCFLSKLVSRGMLANPRGAASRRTLERADESAVSSGQGYIFGSLTVLGSAEMQFNPKFDANKGEEAPFSEELDDAWTAQGLPNRRFVLKRRAIPNGQRVPLPPHTQSTVPVMLDYATDIFRVGRQKASLLAARSGAIYNDVVISGPRTAQGAPMMPRFACHIVVDRKPPFTVRLYAGGSPSAEGGEGTSPAARSDGYWRRTGGEMAMTVEEANRERKHKEVAANDTRDRYAHPLLRGASSSDFAPRGRAGVRLWRPDSRIWMDVSPLGWTSEYLSSSALPQLRHYRHQKAPGRLVGHPTDRGNSKSNELIDGAILDVYGVLMSFSSATTMETFQPRLSPKDLIQRLNGSNPTCPVLYNSLVFTHTSAKERAFREYLRLKQNCTNRLQCNGTNSLPLGAAFLTIGDSFATTPFTVPLSDLEGSERRAMVFPACGHVFGYHKSLYGQACPMCRTVGPFKPLVFSFEPALHGPVHSPADAVHTHVFNPCGHAASNSTCQRWASTYFMPESLRCHPGSHLLGRVGRKGRRAGLSSAGSHCVCPYCSCVLDPDKPYSRLVIQTDGETGQGKSDVDDDGISMECGKTEPNDYDRLLRGRPREYPMAPGLPSRLHHA